MTTPLLTKGDGTKFGKTESGTLWLDPALTSPYAFYQFWINTEDQLVGPSLRSLTFRSREDIEELEAATVQRPQDRLGQRALAEDLTTLVHGVEETSRVVAASKALFGQGELSELDPVTLGAALREAPHVQVPAGPLPPLVELLTATELVASKSAARRAINEGGAYLNNVRISDPDAVPTENDLVRRTLAGAASWQAQSGRRRSHLTQGLVAFRGQRRPSPAPCF